MSIKILGGIGKGLSLFVPKGMTVRPTSVLLRRKIFDAHQNLAGRYFIDLCAGSGAMGIEAWSRGAEIAYLIEKDKGVFKILEKNRDVLQQKFSTELKERLLELHCASVALWIRHFKKIYQSWSDAKQGQTIIFFDPPYAKVELFKDLQLDEWFAGTFWLESDQKKGQMPQKWGINFEKIYWQGDSYIIVSN